MFRDRHQHRKVRNLSGFTLIELVISITLLAFIVGILYTSLTQIIGGAKLLDDRRDSTAIASAVVGRMTRELQLAYGGTNLMPPQENLKALYQGRIPLIGKSQSFGESSSGDSITFLALEGGQYLPDGGTHSGLVQITYRVAQSPDDPEGKLLYLIRDETPYGRPYDRFYAKTMTFPITTALVNLKIRYFDKSGQRWVSEWGADDHTGLPSLIKFSVTLRTPAGNEETFSTSVAIRAT